MSSCTRSLLRPLSVALIAMALATGCTTLPPAPPAAALFHDALFDPPAQPIRADDIFAMSDAMKRYADGTLARPLATNGARALLEAMYNKTSLQLEYDAERTRNAAEAFEARAGNCLSLVIMTAAIAKHLNVQVTYNNVYTEETWTRDADTYFASSHVNLTLGRRTLEAPNRSVEARWTIDFLPSAELEKQRSRVLDESTVVAMYMNNRAAETLAAGALNDAYAWARAAIAHDPRFLSAYNTLGVIYLRRGHAAHAERALAYVLQATPDSTVALANMARVLERQGRLAEARDMRDRLAKLDPEPPFHFYDLGRAAMDAGDYRGARAWFAKEIARAPYQHEFHFWMAVAEYKLGDVESARQHLVLALSTSTTPGKKQLYAAKLDQLTHQAWH